MGEIPSVLQREPGTDHQPAHRGMVGGRAEQSVEQRVDGEVVDLLGQLAGVV